VSGRTCPTTVIKVYGGATATFTYAMSHGTTPADRPSSGAPRVPVLSRAFARLKRHWHTWSRRYVEMRVEALRRDR
jgi:hypothetical protein